MQREINGKKYKYNTIDHTSDVGLEATGSTLQNVFENLLNGVISIMKGESSTSDHEELLFSFKADSYENILFDSIMEIIYQIEVKGNFPVEIKVISIDEQGNSAEGVLTKMTLKFKYIPLDDVREIKSMIKAPTYHRIELKKEMDKKYFGRIILDV